MTNERMGGADAAKYAVFEVAEIFGSAMHLDAHELARALNKRGFVSVPFPKHAPDAVEAAVDAWLKDNGTHAQSMHAAIAAYIEKARTA